MTRCPHCATELEEGARFCGACGKKVDARPVSPLEETDVAPPTAGRRADISGTIRPFVRSSDGAQAGNPSGGLESAAMTLFQSAKGGSPASPVNSIAPVAPVAANANALTVPGGGAASAAIAPAPSPAAIRPASHGAANLIGRTLNHRYLVEDKIGEGGFGAVFRGKQIATGREVALKILHPHNSSDPTIIARFKREAEACSKLRDVHTVTTYDFDETEDGVLYLAMELLRGRSLHHLQKSDGPLPAARVLGIVDQVAQSLGEAHANGIVHRDMKPENVFVESRQVGAGAGSSATVEDHVKVLDFGIAKMISGEKEVQALTAVGQTLGTLEFMSPEQLRGQTLDGRSDIYALGMMSYEMLTGVLPFQGAKTPIEIINFHMKQAAPAPSKLKEGIKIPSAVDDIILKMVAKNRDDRFADTGELREAIAKALASQDRSADKFEAKRVALVIGATILVVGVLLAILAH
ncbi:MAG TPA: serine/threonine-protein kinase [Polyangia bacterium]|nr:serine/threonine-protein kinase [Polyangia bacterium]